VDVLDLEVAGGVVDERLPRAERSVIALVERVPSGAGWTLSITQSGAIMSTRRVASRSWNARLKRSMTSSVVCVMSVGFIIAVSFLVGVGSGLAPLPSTRCPGSRVKVSRRSVRRDHRPDLIGCGRSAIPFGTAPLEPFGAVPRVADGSSYSTHGSACYAGERASHGSPRSPAPTRSRSSRRVGSSSSARRPSSSPAMARTPPWQRELPDVERPRSGVRCRHV
jgi:hypothetical protein